MLKPGNFYDTLADRYDAMTQFSARLDAQRRVLSDLLQRYPARRAVDMGCGTGVHAIALAQLGVDVTGVDVSEGMLGKARMHAAEIGVTVEFLHGDFLAGIPRPPADLILCLGNSLPHLESRDALAEALGHWRALCAEGRHVVIQLLNYRRVLARRERIVNIRRDGPETIVRFYDFLADALQFNILSIRDTENGSTHDLHSTRLMPFLDTDITTAAAEAGFHSVEKFGSLRLEPFTDESTDLVAILE